MCHLCRLVYLDGDVWASKKPGENRTFVPEKMSAPARYLLGDFKRTGLVDFDNKFNVCNLGSDYNDKNSSNASIKVQNGFFVDKVTDMQGLIMEDKSTKSIVVVFRGTDFSIRTADRFMAMGKDMLLTFALSTLFKSDPTRDKGGGKVHGGMIKSWTRMHKVVLPIIKSLLETGDFERVVVTGHR